MSNRYYFIVSNVCNMKCDFCYERDKTLINESEESLLSMLTAEDHLVLIGGEPLVKIDKLKRIIDTMSNRVDEITIVTNGTLITRDLISFIKEYDNVFIQISVYSLKHLDELSLLNYKNVLYHILITEYNIKEIPTILYNVSNYLSNRIWVSIDRFINTDISNDLKALFRSKLLTKEMIRDIGYVGKKCGVMSKENKVIDGNKVVDDCLSRVTSGTTLSINRECLNCDNVYCDACICDDVVKNREVTCAIFNTIKKEIENES